MVFWIIFLWIVAITYLFQRRLSNAIIGEDGECVYIPNKSFCILIWSIPLLFICLCSSFGDREVYISHFINSPLTWSEVKAYSLIWDDSRLFYCIQGLFKMFISKNAYVWLGLISIFQAYCVTKTLKKYSVDFGMSMFIFIASCMMISWMCNGIRQFIAVSILFACTDWILNRNWIKYYFVAFILMGAYPVAKVLGIKSFPWILGGIHQSVLIIFPIYFCIRGKMLNKKMWIMILGISLFAIFGELSGLMGSVVSVTVFEKDFTKALDSSGINPFRFLISMVPVVLMLFKRQQIEQEEVPAIIHLSINASIVSAVLYAISLVSHGSLIGRLPVYTDMYNLILIPWLVQHEYHHNSLIKTMMYSAYTLVFFMQVNTAWADIPYVSTILHIG